MATDLKPTSRFMLTRFAGPKGQPKFQVTSPFGDDTSATGFVTMTQSEAVELAQALLECVARTRRDFGAV